MKALLDGSILIDHLNAVPEARAAINAYDGCISSITLNELISAEYPREQQPVLLEFLRQFEVINANTKTYELALELHNESGMDLQNALTYATAKRAGLVLVTSNSMVFQDAQSDVKIPYHA